MQINGTSGGDNINCSLITGGYYTGAVGSSITLATHSSFSYGGYTGEASAPIGYDISNSVGKKLTIIRVGADTSGALVAFTDSSLVILLRLRHGLDTEFVPQGDGTYKAEVIIPANAKYFYFSSKTSTFQSIKVEGESVKGIVEYVAENVDNINKLSTEIQPKSFPILPYKILKTSNGYKLKNDLYTELDVAHFQQMYVDSINGSDTNNGKEATPYKTLKKALQAFVSGTSKTCINIVNDAVFYADALNGETKVLKSLAIIAKNKASLICGFGSATWSTYSTNVKVADCSGYTILGCVDTNETNRGKDGIFAPMEKVTSIDLCESTENSYFISGTNVYVHCKLGADVSKIIPMIDSYLVRWNHQSASTPSHFLYLKNIEVIGAYYDACRSATYLNEASKFEYFAENCIFQHNMKGDAIPHNDYDVSYDINCVCGYSKADLFNSHHSYSTQTIKDNCVVVTMNCVAREAGFYATSHGNNNLFTSHDGENVLRLNCRGMNADGPLFADVNGCRSFYADCESWNTKYYGVAANGSWQFNDVSKTNDGGFVSLENCSIYDSRGNYRIYCECPIEIKNTDVFTNCNITGEITIFI